MSQLSTYLFTTRSASLFVILMPRFLKYSLISRASSRPANTHATDVTTSKGTGRSEHCAARTVFVFVEILEDDFEPFLVFQHVMDEFPEVDVLRRILVGNIEQLLQAIRSLNHTKLRDQNSTKYTFERNQSLWHQT